MSELLFLVEEDPDGGFSARALDQSIFTQGETREELAKNIKDAVRCHFNATKDMPKMLRLHFVRDEVLAL